MSNNNLNRDYIKDYLIPVIHRMYKKTSHTEAFKEVADKLQVTINTVRDRCTRGIDINTSEFVNLVRTDKIKQHLLIKFPDKADILNRYL
jgi:hypothetical protein